LVTGWSGVWPLHWTFERLDDGVRFAEKPKDGDIDGTNGRPWHAAAEGVCRGKNRYTGAGRTMNGDPQAKAGRKRWSPGRVVPLLVLLVGLAAFFVSGLHKYMSFEMLAEHRDWLTAQIERYGLLANLAFIVIYAIVIAFSIPVGAALTVAGGFLFGTLATTVCVVIGATVGAVALFLAARSALFEVLHAKAGPAVLKMEEGFRENALSYLLVLRLIPLFPFWLVNLVPALLGVPLKVYVIGTAIGIIPGTFVYASAGNGLGALLEKGESPNLSMIFDLEVLTPILGLAVLSLLPVFYKVVKARGARQS
jgi:uncharacterized membrane protein YdjX (TVP38/TMEM64 family)